eukprot:UC4_evm2s1059
MKSGSSSMSLQPTFCRPKSLFLDSSILLRTPLKFSRESCEGSSFGPTRCCNRGSRAWGLAGFDRLGPSCARNLFLISRGLSCSKPSNFEGSFILPIYNMLLLAATEVDEVSQTWR